MLRGSTAFLLVSVLLAPGVAAFSSAQEELAIAYSAGATPTMISAGALLLDGSVETALVIAGANGTSLDRIPELRILDRTALLPVQKVERGATILVESGAMVWTFHDGASADIATTERYAIAIALPRAPVPAQDGATPPPGFIMAGESITGTLAWPAARASLVPIDAVITITDARGQPLPGWDAREVNSDVTMGDNPDGVDIAFEVEGAFTTRLASSVVGGATGGDSELRLVIGPAEEDRFEQAAFEFETATTPLFGDASPFSGPQNPLDVFAQVSGLLNGALLIVPGADGGQTPAPLLIESTLGGADFPLGAFNLVRGDDLQLSWGASQMRIRGEPTVVLGRDGFGVNEPVRVGIFPILSLVLWVIAAAAIVYYFVRRPPKAGATWTLRLASFAFYLVVLALVFYFWDRSFAQSFGTSALTVAREDGISSATLPRLGLLLGFELVPWGIAALLFALPVRIAAGVGLRYLGRGKSLSGVATAAGLVSLAIFGPIYALWCFNLVWSRIAGALPSG